MTTLFTRRRRASASWSSFLPTNDAVVFEDELVAGSGQFGFTWQDGPGRALWVDLATHDAARARRSSTAPATCRPTARTPAPPTRKLNYEPTVNPVVSGGYAWVVFTSRRLYGNVATIDAYNSDPRLYDWQHDAVTPKKLWVAAIDLNAPAGSDPSHPAFYLPAQELFAGNARGFWTVDPCHADGTSCETGDECCGGYCRPRRRRRRAHLHQPAAELLGGVREVHDDRRLLRRLRRASPASTASARRTQPIP